MGRAVALVLGGLALSACTPETRQKLLPIFFDGVPREGQPGAPPPTRRVRRDLQQEIEELKRKLAEAQATAKALQEGKPAEAPQLVAEKAKTWDEAVEALPRDAAGNVDWVKAMKEGAIAPRPGVDPKAAEQAALDLDVDLTTSGTRAFAVTYPHAAHTQWLTCGNCHPAIFPLKRGAEPTRITMARIQAGEQCGACHGKVAFPVEKGCPRCHTRVPPKADWRPTEEPRKPIERAKAWDEAVKLLPVTAGAPDWAKALAEGVIAPRPGVDPKAADQPVFPITVERRARGLFKAVFPHAAHTAVLGCPNCHPAPFQMKGGATPITMSLINEGQSCGACHGKVAFAVEKGCPRCHVAIPARADWRPPEEARKPIEKAGSWDEAAKLLPITAGAPDWAKALADGVIAPRPGVDPKAADQPVFPITVERTPPGQPAFKAVFPHAAHTAWLGCPNCHPAPFQMKGGATPMNMAALMAGQACGACHGKVAFPVTACARCHPAMAPPSSPPSPPAGARG